MKNSSRTNNKLILSILLGFAALIGGGGLLTFMIFLFNGPFNLLDLGLGEIQLLFLNSLLCIVFFLQHSGMARRSFYQRIGPFLPEKSGSAIYTITSGIAVLTLVILWQESTYTLFSARGIAQVILRALFFLAIACVIWSLSTGFLVLYRLQSTVDHLRGRERRTAPLITHGPYRWVRHPLYLSALFLVWTYPELTLDRLVLDLSFTTWVIVGTLLEERKLLAIYGEEFRRYQRDVPMMIPRISIPVRLRRKSREAVVE